MRVSISYKQYKNSPRATNLSWFAGFLTSFSVIFIIVIISFVGRSLIKHFDNGYVALGLILSVIISYIALIVFCNKIARKWAILDNIEVQFDRKLTKEEKDIIWKKIKEKK